MDDYLKNLSEAETAVTDELSQDVHERGAVDLLQQNTGETISNDPDGYNQQLQDDAPYLSTQKIKFNKYTLKKG